MISSKYLESIFTREEYIYHYTTIEKALEYILQKRELKFSSLNETNDPIEFLNFSYRITGDNRSELKSAWKIASKVNSIVKEKIKISCFCLDESPNHYIQNTHDDLVFIKGYSRSRMWSQYADNHRGVCLIFNKQKLIETIKKEKIIVEKKYDLLDGNIIYSNNTEEYSRRFNLLAEELNRHTPLEKIQINVKEYLFWKLLDYKDEQEYRIALLPLKETKGNNDIFINYNESLVGIIAGCMLPKAYEINLMEKSKQLNINFFKLNWSYGKPELSKINY